MVKRKQLLRCIKIDFLIFYKMITPSTSITSDDSTNKTVTVTPKPVNNPYQLEVHRLNVLQVALNIALDTPDAKPREHPALPSNNDTKGKRNVTILKTTLQDL